MNSERQQPLPRRSLGGNRKKAKSQIDETWPSTLSQIKDLITDSSAQVVVIVIDNTTNYTYTNQTIGSMSHSVATNVGGNANATHLNN